VDLQTIYVYTHIDNISIYMYIKGSYAFIVTTRQCKIKMSQHHTSS